MRIVLLGPPGAGKGTQAKRLAEELNLAHIATGDLLRQNVASNTELGKRASSHMDKGILVPDTLVTQMLIQRFAKDDVKKGFILDGFPRNIAQAKTLDDVLSKMDMDIDTVIYLDTSVPVIIQRLSGRLVCKNCGANFHIKNMPPKIDASCDICGGKLYQRSDDNEETISKRLEVYQKEAASLIKYYEAKQKLVHLPADGTSDSVLAKMIDLVKEF